MKSIFILLTKTNTMCARMIRGITGDSYTHVSIALDKELNELYSFARRNIYFPLIAGLIQENVDTGIFKKNLDTPCILYELHVSDAVYDAIRARIDYMMDNYELYRYNFLGLVTCFLGIPYEREHHFVCSQFVAHVLDKYGVISFPKNANLIKPADFCDLPELHEVYSGKLRYVKIYSVIRDTIREVELAKAVL